MFDSTALLGLFRPFQMLSGDRRAISFWLARGADLLADWVFIVALLISIYAVTADVAIVALFMLLRVLPRGIVILGFQQQVGRIGSRGLVVASIPRFLLIGCLAFVDARSDLVWAGAVVFAYGLLSATLNEARAAILPSLVERRRLAEIIHLNVSIERVSFVLGPLLAAFVIWVGNADTAMVVSALLLLLTSILLGIWQQSSSQDSSLWPANPEPPSIAWQTVRHQPVLLLLTGGLFTGAALAICLKVVLIDLATMPLGRSEESLGVLLALVGVGTLLGPLSVPRLLGHLPIPLIVTGAALGIVAAVVLVSVVTRLEIVVLALLGIGLISITNDLVTVTATRRIAPESELPGAGRLLLAAAIAGQVIAAAVVALLARIWDTTDVMLAVGIACAVLMAGLFVAADGLSIVTRRLARPGS